MQQSHRVFVTGATGFVGRAVIHALRTAGHSVRCLVRRGSERDLRGLEAIERVEGDVLSPESLEIGMAGCDVLVHLVGIIREFPSRGITFERVHHRGTVNVLAAAGLVGVRRVVHMSALGTRPGARSLYHQSKLAAEEAVRATPLAWTIFRPSVIYGRGDGFISMLARMVDGLPVVPVIGSGRERLQPIQVERVADAFAKSIDLPATVKQTFEVGGPDVVTMLELLDLIGHAKGKSRVLKFHVPMSLVRPIARLLHPLSSFPVTPDQLLMLEEDTVCDPGPFFSTFGLTPTPLAVGLKRMFE